MMRGSFLVASACLAACAAAGAGDYGDMDINVGGEPSAFDAVEPEPVARMLVLEAEAGESAELLMQLWTAAEVLPVEKRAALAQPFLALGDLSPERATMATWETRVGARFEADGRASDSYDTFTSKARALYEAEGAGVFLSRARDGAPPFNIGRPDTLSMMAVQTITLCSRRTKSTMIFSSSGPLICPWATTTRASGTLVRTRSAKGSIELTRLWTTNTCPPRVSSR